MLYMPCACILGWVVQVHTVRKIMSALWSATLKGEGSMAAVHAMSQAGASEVQPC